MMLTYCVLLRLGAETVAAVPLTGDPAFEGANQCLQAHISSGAKRPARSEGGEMRHAQYYGTCCPGPCRGRRLSPFLNGGGALQDIEVVMVSGTGTVVMVSITGEWAPMVRFPSLVTVMVSGTGFLFLEHAQTAATGLVLR
jgi:hypothetical protein